LKRSMPMPMVALWRYGVMALWRVGAMRGGFFQAGLAIIR